MAVAVAVASTSPEVRANAVGGGSVCGESDWKHGSIGEAARLTGVSAELPMRGVAVVCSGVVWRLMLEALRRGTQASRDEPERPGTSSTGARTYRMGPAKELEKDVRLQFHYWKTLRMQDFILTIRCTCCPFYPQKRNSKFGRRRGRHQESC